MHDSGALRALSLWYEYCVSELKYYLTLNEGFGEMVHFLCPSLSFDHSSLWGRAPVKI